MIFYLVWFKWQPKRKRCCNINIFDASYIFENVKNIRTTHRVDFVFFLILSTLPQSEEGLLKAFCSSENDKQYLILLTIQSFYWIKEQEALKDILVDSL